MSESRGGCRGGGGGGGLADRAIRLPGDKLVLPPAAMTYVADRLGSIPSLRALPSGTTNLVGPSNERGRGNNLDRNWRRKRGWGDGPLVIEPPDLLEWLRQAEARIGTTRPTLDDLIDLGLGWIHKIWVLFPEADAGHRPEPGNDEPLVRVKCHRCHKSDNIRTNGFNKSSARWIFTMEGYERAIGMR